ncbi:MAG TPA: biotin--[acetyl-CoA-carboxylase] ligase [Xanthobacteraceae bacterium]|nr:biotin--[acetyl-CoA-carboxylase] ligase [Xanthobacteraceae bacterium]
MQPHSQATLAGIRLIAHDSVGSTNAEALALARAGSRLPAWVMARRQTAGRGRRGRAWVSPPGNLYATLLLIDPCGAELAPQLSFVGGLAAHDAVSEAALLLSLRLRLKWPNDLLLDGRKLAGVLVEGERLGDGTFAVAVGVGINCSSHPENAAYPATNLAVAGSPVVPDELFETLARAMAVRLAQWRRGANFSVIRADWLARSFAIGETIRLRTPEETEGRFAGIDEQGRLLLETPNGLRTVAAGDLSWPGEAGAGEGAA